LSSAQVAAFWQSASQSGKPEQPLVIIIPLDEELELEGGAQELT
jgi:hypothetical protein